MREGSGGLKKRTFVIHIYDVLPSVKNAIVAPRPFMQCNMNLLHCSSATVQQVPDRHAR